MVQTQPPAPIPQPLLLMVRDIIRTKCPDTAITLTRSCYDHALRLQHAKDPLAPDWLALSLIALSKAGQLMTEELVALVPNTPPFIVSGSLLERLQNGLRQGPPKPGC